MHFLMTATGLRAVATDIELDVLRGFAQDLLALLGDDETDDGTGGGSAGADPLEALLGLPSGRDPDVPEDPALARLLPNAYGDDDPDASREFRRYTEGDLRAGKRANCTTVLATLPASGDLALDRDQADAWLGFLNDLRLVLGVRLEVTDDDPEDDDPDDDADDEPGDGSDQGDAREHALAVYRWLGAVQESLLSCLLPRH